MGRLFGTDGVRGVANTELSCELAMDIGRAAAYVLTKETAHKAKIVIGRDTRVSGDMLENALVAGICSVGADAVLLGVIPTPAVAYLVKKYNADAGVVISASHNPVEFNGIKIFNGDGFKLADAIEDEIETYILEKKDAIERKTHGDIGSVTRCETAVRDYVDHIEKCVDGDLRGVRVAIDCANGASSEPAKLLFTELGADCTFVANEPDGRNINAGVGSTHLDNLRAAVRACGAQIGIAFDGDADRCLAVDENGGEIDGDMIIAIFAKALKAQGKLAKDTAVVTVMTNLGFMDFCKKYGISAVRTAVGDRYVLEEMQRSGYCIGGEQSGHIILLEYATTGDGEMTAAMLLKVLKASGGRASDLAKEIERYPQTLVNVRTTPEGKKKFKEDEELQGFIEAAQQELFDTGRVLVRVSGTEPLIRIMVEGRDEALINKVAKDLESKVNERIN
ncbi:MAG: phosphoglucosamine mutase [Oscillospiraceae bacterium]|nr:phosphoglucosamine mutase [Oscillospiraceae bacterium]